MTKSYEFVLDAELSTTINENLEKNRFQFLFQIDHLADVGQGASFYDPELKMHFVDRSAIGAIYQIDIQNIYLELSPRLAKAADFIRRVNYVNDWMEIKVNGKGVVMSVENRKELKDSWKELRRMLSHDFPGKAVEEKLTKIDERLNVPDKILRAVYTYMNFGLIFPHIPPKHGENWENRRQVALSEYENETVEEHLYYAEEHEGARRYNVSLSSTPEQQMEVEQASGYVLVSKEEIFPKEARVEVSYRNKIIQNVWTFRLDKY